MKIFLSYPHTHSDIARTVLARLQVAGHTVFHDRSNLRAGEGYDEAIRHAIQGSDLFVILLARDSLREGAYSRTELKHAEETWPNPTNHVLPVLLEEEAMASLPSYLTAVTVLRPTGELASEVVTEVGKIAGAPMRRVKRMARLGAAAVVALLAAYLVYRGLPRQDVDLLVNAQGALYTASAGDGTVSLRATTPYLDMLERASTGEVFVNARQLARLLNDDLTLSADGFNELRLARGEMSFDEFKTAQWGSVEEMSRTHERALPALRFGMVNNSEDTLLIDQLRLSITDSQVDETALLAIDYWMGDLVLMNHGWGELQDITLSYNLFLPWEVVDSETWRYRSEARALGAAASISFSIDDAVTEVSGLSAEERRQVENRLESVDHRGATDLVMRRLRDRSPEASDERISMQQAMALVTEGLQFVAVIEYSPASHPGQRQRFHVAYNIPVAQLMTTGAGFTNPSGVYDLKLQPEQDQYTLTLPIQHYIEAGKTETIDVRLWGEKSSLQTIRASARVDGKWIETRDAIELQYYRPDGADWGIRAPAAE